MGFASAALAVETGGAPLTSHIAVAKGHPGNPITWDDMRRKYDGLVGALLGNRAGDLFDALHGFGGGASLPVMHELARV